MTLWFNVTGQESSGEDTIAAQVEGRALLRRRTYDDRIISTFDDGFVVQYTLTIVHLDGTRRALWACAVATVHDGLIVRLDEKTKIRVLKSAVAGLQDPTSETENK